MCGLCGLIAEQLDWGDRIKTGLPRRQERYRKIKIINQLLQFHRIKVSDFQGVNYVIQSATGQSAVTNGLNQLWREMEGISSRGIDVLDEDYLNYLQKEVIQ